VASDDYDPRFNPVYQRGHEDDLMPAPLPPTDRVGRPRSPRNPWVPVLWVLAIGLLAFGVWAELYAQKLIASPNVDSVEEYYVIPTVLAELAPWFVAVGLAAIVAAVVLHAVRWRDG